MPNTLIIGSRTEPLLHHIPAKRFLIIDDGPLIDRLDISSSRTVIRFDPAVHCFNPLKDIDYPRATEFLGVLDAVFPEGQDTLTNRNSRFQLLEALLDKPKRLDTLIKDSKETRDAYQKVQRLLMSPVLERVLNHPTNMSFKGSIIARLDRAVLGDFDCFVLANFLISQFAGTVVLPDFGFYAVPAHRNLIRQGRLIAGIRSFDQVPDFRSDLLAIENKHASRAIPDDAKILAQYAGIPRDTIAHSDFIDRSIR